MSVGKVFFHTMEDDKVLGNDPPFVLNRLNQ